MQITFKDAEEVNEKILINLWSESFKFGWLPDFWKKKKFRQFSYFLTKKCSWEFFKYWLILCDDEPAGFVLITFGSDRCPELILSTPFTMTKKPATIHEVYIRRQFRGCGVGKQTRFHIETFCNEKELRLSFPNKREWRLFEQEL
jgi:predicted acetyltransferase